MSDHPDGSNHNLNGSQTTVGPERVGNEWVTWRRTWCTCGKWMENSVVSRVKIEDPK